MKLCILEADTNADTDLINHGSIPTQFMAWLGPALPEATWTNIAVHDGADLPDPARFDAYLITGSRHGVYDDLAWMAPLAGFIQTLRDRSIPLGGICFGHQIMAHAYGATVEKSDEGWILGAQDYDGKTAFAMHQDQVRNVPEGASKVVSGKKCEIARLEYDFPALSVQYHPEFSAGFMKTLLDMYQDDIASDRISTARNSLRSEIHVDAIAQDFAQLFRTHIK